MATTIPTKLIQLRNNDGFFDTGDSGFMGQGFSNGLPQINDKKLAAGRNHEKNHPAARTAT
jgi:hypothetical protein